MDKILDYDFDALNNSEFEQRFVASPDHIGIITFHYAILNIITKSIKKKTLQNQIGFIHQT